MKSLVTACMALLASVATVGAKPNDKAPGDGGAAALISRYRAAHGLGPVKVDPILTRAARQQAQAMAAAGVLSHDIAGGLNSRLRAVGYANVPMAENVGAGHRSLQAAMESWQRSPGHQANLLMSSATRVGIARVDAPGKPYGVYWALVLAAEPAGPRGSAEATGRSPFSGFGFSFGR
ncbi:MAG: CAP domain-containing protein [Beijerinckiaceae bacterium]|jgi:hypothetical protein|nr:CAP domain-containing protein [Beijerinckiaceae bacterium]MDO9442218.1 CAP domain-containing protein [Beijerinckiaceae bacterium]